MTTLPPIVVFSSPQNSPAGRRAAKNLPFFGFHAVNPFFFARDRVSAESETGSPSKVRLFPPLLRLSPSPPSGESPKHPSRATPRFFVEKAQLSTKILCLLVSGMFSGISVLEEEGFLRDDFSPAGCSPSDTLPWWPC